jgi:hypothetical protein
VDVEEHDLGLRGDDPGHGVLDGSGLPNDPAAAAQL